MSIQISIAASSDENPKNEAIKKMKTFLDEIINLDNDVNFLTGGGGGLMTLLAEEVNKKDSGQVVGIKPISMENISEKNIRWNPYNDININSGMNFVSRSSILVNSGNVLVALGGGVGTMIEIFMAYNLSIPAIVITKTGYPTDGIKRITENQYLDHKKLAKIYFTPEPKEAAKLALKKS